ncbi:hypothetical protein CHISP_3486 [Chitinispirillum alkaliphilum]|nr:hypothetical protein CHISP_3486 [Chitinispirillum alkaliphilum]
MYYIYILRSDEGKYYIGSTEDVEKRIDQHNSKKYKSWSSRYNNWVLVHKEEFATRRESLIREKEIKSYKGGEAFKRLTGSSLGS